MQRRVATATVKDELERANGRRAMTIGRTSRDELLAQFRQARKRLGAAARR